jgi:hypothetical protein
MDPAGDNVHITRNAVGGRSRPIRLAARPLFSTLYLYLFLNQTWLRYVGLRLEKIQDWN